MLFLSIPVRVRVLSDDIGSKYVPLFYTINFNHLDVFADKTLIRQISLELGHL